MTAGGSGGIVPDDKDWTWTLLRACPECGFEAGRLPPEDLAGLVLDLTAPWPEVLARPGVADRPDPATWSALEYGCHVRDVCRLFDERTRLVLAEDRPTFPNWDQDATAVAERYGEQDPVLVAAALTDAARAWSRTVAGVPADARGREGVRSDGSRFDLVGLVRYGLHDLAHHLWDVGAARR